LETRRILSSLCYFSIFFAGFLFPLVVYLASNDHVTKQHAKAALLSHLIPLILIPLFVMSIFYDMSRMAASIPILTLITSIVMGLVSLAVVIWNIVKGVKALRAE